MYQQYFGFREEPFSLTPDPAFIYLSEQHSVAYSLLEYGVLQQAGFTVITGDVGCGKTTLIRRLIDDLGLQVTLGLLDNTHPRLDNLMEWVSMAFGLDYKAKDAVDLYDSFVQFLAAEYAARRRVILIIDEAQNLDPDTLEELRTLSNINAGRHRVLQMILVGQPELKATLDRPELSQFSQRVVAHYALKPLTEAETQGYIEHRLAHAGGRPNLFNPEACRLIHRQAKGIPRLINLLCSTALVYAYAEEVEQIGADTIQTVLEDGAAGLCMGAKATKGPEPRIASTAPGKATPRDPGADGRPQSSREQATQRFSVEDARQLFSNLVKPKP
ncbi:MAG: ExeA family protein [Bdellovibrio bacteriovorus]